jgi:tRNA pseudouridine38-40 synthase
VHLKETAVRTVHDCTVTVEDPHRLRIDISGSGFLYNMVRIIAGTLIDVGRGRTDADAIPAILAAKERKRAGDTAPPHGLCLMWVRYD